MSQQYEVFPHEDAFIIVKHLTGAQAGFAKAVWDEHKVGPGRVLDLRIADAYACARRYSRKNMAQRVADRLNNGGPSEDMPFGFYPGENF